MNPNNLTLLTPRPGPHVCQEMLMPCPTLALIPVQGSAHIPPPCMFPVLDLAPVGEIVINSDMHVPATAVAQLSWPSLILALMYVSDATA